LCTEEDGGEEMVRFVIVQYHQSDVPVNVWGRAAVEVREDKLAREMIALVSCILRFENVLKYVRIETWDWLMVC
jgi:hypothetical protein